MAALGTAPRRRRARALTRFAGAAGLAGVVAAGYAATADRGSEESSTARDAAARQRAVAGYAKLPLRFERNRGQTASEARFVSRGAGYTLFLTDREAVISLAGDRSGSHGARQAPAAVLRMRLLGANPRPRMDAARRLPGTTNHLTGPRSRWRTGVPGYAQVRYANAYPGIDLVYHGRQGRLEYDFKVAPGADPGRIALGFRGARRLRLDRKGALVAETPAGPVRQSRPVLYQRIGGRRRAVAGRYELQGGGRVGFRVGRYDRSRPLVIDPVLSYATYLGGLSGERLQDIAVDSAGSAYVTGWTGSDSFPTTAGALDTQRTEQDAFVTKLSPQGSALVYSTFLGGAGNDIGEGIAVDASGRAYVTGLLDADSADFPTTVSGFDRTVPGAGDAFLSVLNPPGSALSYSTFLGGSTAAAGLAATDRAGAVAVDGAGMAYVTGQTCSTNFPTKAPAHDATSNGQCDAFVTKFNPAASGAASLVASTYLGGAGEDMGSAIALGASGPYVAGSTFSDNFPNSATAFQADRAGESDVFLTVLNTGLSGLASSTYLGGSDFDRPTGLDVDASGQAFASGFTQSEDFPVQAALQDQRGGASDMFVAKILGDGSDLSYSTYLGGDGEEFAGEIGVDSSGGAYVGGFTSSDDFPSLNPVSPRGSGTDPFAVRIVPSGSGFSFASYLGGGASDDTVGEDLQGGPSVGVALGPSGSAFFSGATDSTDLPTQGPAQAVNNGRGVGDRHDGWILKLQPDAPGSPLVTGLSPRSGPAGTRVIVRGSGLSGATSVRFGGVAAPSFTVRSATEIVAVAPAHGEGGAAVTVARPSGSSPANPIARFVYAEGLWAPGAALTGPHSQGSATALRNGKVLVAGGCCDPDIGAPFDTAELYNAARGAWIPTGRLNQGRARHTATVLADGRVLVLGGCCDPATGEPFASAEIYDPATGAWTTNGALDVARGAHSATLLRSGEVLVAGGTDAVGGSIEGSELYDPATGDSTPTDDLGTKRANHTATLLTGGACNSGSPPAYCGKILVAGGVNQAADGSDQPVATAELYDPATDQWTPTGSLAAARQRHSATLLRDGRVLVAGGRERFLSINASELYEPANGAWVTPNGLMRTRRDGHAAVLLSNGKVLLAGGQDGASVWNTAELFNPVSNRFNLAGLMTRYRGGLDTPPLAALLGNGKALVAGGGGTAGSEASSELFDPTPPTSPRPPPVLDRIAPVVTRFGLTRRRFRVGRRGTARVARTRRTRVGSAFVYRLSEPASVRIVIQKRVLGRRVGGRCRAATRRRRGRPRCIRYVSVGALQRSGRSGRNRHAFSGRIGRRKLLPARYRALLRATDAAGNRSAARRAGFRIVRR